MDLLCAFYDPWARARGVLVSIENPRRDLSQQRERFRVHQAIELGSGTLDSKATQHHDQMIGAERGELVPAADCRVASGAGTHVDAPGSLHQVRDPVARKVQRLEPLETKNPMPGYGRHLQPLETSLQPQDQLLRFVSPVDGKSHLTDIVPDPLEVTRLEGHDTGR